MSELKMKGRSKNFYGDSEKNYFAASNRSAKKIKKLPQRYAAIVLPLLLSVLMTCIVSLISTVRSVGLAPHLLTLWLGAWGISWIVAFPTLLLVLPLVKRATAALVHVNNETA